MAKNRSTNLLVVADKIQKFVAVSQADLVQPFAAEWQWGMVQANQNEGGIVIINDLLQACHFFFADKTACITVHTAVNADNQPVANLQ